MELLHSWVFGLDLVNILINWQFPKCNFFPLLSSPQYNVWISSLFSFSILSLSFQFFKCTGDLRVVFISIACWLTTKDFLPLTYWSFIHLPCEISILNFCQHLTYFLYFILMYYSHWFIWILMAHLLGLISFAHGRTSPCFT